MFCKGARTLHTDAASCPTTMGTGIPSPNAGSRLFLTNAQPDSSEPAVAPKGPVLCQRVAELRKKQSLTLDQLARVSGISRSMLSQIERGQTNPALAVTFRIG